MNIALFEFKVTDKNDYDLNFKTTGYIRDKYKLLMGYMLTEFYKDIIYTYPIIPIKYPLDKYTCSKWSKFTNEVGDMVHIIRGDDLTMTNLPNTIQAVDQGYPNCLLIRVNNIDSIYKSIYFVQPPNKIIRGLINYN